MGHECAADIVSYDVQNPIGSGPVPDKGFGIFMMDVDILANRSPTLLTWTPISDPASGGALSSITARAYTATE
jgi:hypothetical protein